MSDIQVWEVAEPYLHNHCLLGEGPYYEAATHSLRFIDIRRKHIYTVDLAAGPASLTTLELDSPVGVTADIEGVDPSDKILAGLKYGLAVVDRKTGAYEYLARFDAVRPGADYERTRANDGAADPHGRFWQGTMTDFGLGPFQQEGALFRFGGDLSGAVVRRDLTIPNGLGWSPDASVMYFTHSTERTVYAFDYSAADGSLSNERKHYVHTGTGEPDGFRVDVDGYIWHAVYGEGRVVKISPTDGRVVGEVRLPTRNITCTQFVGSDLFITTAADEAGEGGAQSKALGGALFRVNVGTTGLPPYSFKRAAA